MKPDKREKASFEEENGVSTITTNRKGWTMDWEWSTDLLREGSENGSWRFDCIMTRNICDIIEPG